MAEGGVIEQLADMLICTLCLTKYTEPRALPCLHTFCLKCLERFVETTRNLRQLKCPLCNEKHQIPAGGVKMFRQDFKVKNLLELENKKCALNVKSASDPSSWLDALKIERCESHPDLESQFCCKNRECKRAIICAKCWVQNHHQHAVFPLKQEYGDIITKIEKARKCQLKIEENIQKVLRAKDKLDRNRLEMRAKVSTRVREYQEMLSELADEVFSAIEKKTNEEIRKATAEIDLLLIIQEELKSADIDLTSNVSTILEKGSQLSNNIRDIQTSVEEWEYKWTKPIVSTSSVSAADMIEFDKTFAAITMQEEVLTSRVGKEERSPIKVENTGALEKSDQTGSKHSTISSRTSTRGEQQITAKESAKWNTLTHFDQIEGIAYYSVGGVENITLRTDPRCMTVYSQTKHAGDWLHSVHGTDDNISGFAVQPNGRHFILDERIEEIRIHNWPLDFNDPDFSLDTKKDASSSIACTRNHYVYVYNNRDIYIHLACLSTMKMPPKLEWYLNTGIAKHRSIDAMENEHGLSVLVSKAVPFGKKPSSQEVALKAVNQNGTLWEITFDDLDNKSKQFDLRSISNDGHNFFVLNSKSRSVHVISSSGQVLNTVVQNLSKPLYLSINREAKKMAVVENGLTVKLYQLTYPEFPSATKYND